MCLTVRSRRSRRRCSQHFIKPLQAMFKLLSAFIKWEKILEEMPPQLPHRAAHHPPPDQHKEPGLPDRPEADRLPHLLIGGYRAVGSSSSGGLRLSDLVCLRFAARMERRARCTCSPASEPRSSRTQSPKPGSELCQGPTGTDAWRPLRTRYITTSTSSSSTSTTHPTPRHRAGWMLSGQQRPARAAQHIKQSRLMINYPD